MHGYWTFKWSFSAIKDNILFIHTIGIILDDKGVHVAGFWAEARCAAWGSAEHLDERPRAESLAARNLMNRICSAGWKWMVVRAMQAVQWFSIIYIGSYSQCIQRWRSEKMIQATQGICLIHGGPHYLSPLCLFNDTGKGLGRYVVCCVSQYW